MAYNTPEVILSEGLLEERSGLMEAEVLVVGLGGMGSAALWHLARRGISAIGIEQFEPGHNQGSSHGHSRIIRKAYYEHPDYVPLVQRAYENWYDLEIAACEPLLLSSPCLTLGSPDSEVLQGVLRSAREHHLPVEELDLQEVHRRYPAFDLRKHGQLAGVVEPTAGILLVERCVRAMIREGKRLGARVHSGETVIDWSPTGTGIEVRTNRRTYQSRQVILTAGPWINHLARDLGCSLTLMRQVSIWHDSSRPDWLRRDRFPVFLMDAPEGAYYGLPALDSRGMKMARHYGAAEVDRVDQIDRTVRNDDREKAQTFLRKYLPRVDGRITDASVCIYTLSPDRHFRLGRHPRVNPLVVATGFSGHGFKFASVVGEILADLAIDGSTRWPIDLFRLDNVRKNGSIAPD